MAGNKGKNRAEVQGDLVSVGSCIRENRKKRGFTQQQLASRIGVGHKTVSSWENGTREISLRSILKLCEVLYIDPNCLLQYKNKEDEFADLRSKLESMARQYYVVHSQEPEEDEKKYLLALFSSSMMTQD